MPLNERGRFITIAICAILTLTVLYGIGLNRSGAAAMTAPTVWTIWIVLAGAYDPAILYPSSPQFATAAECSEAIKRMQPMGETSLDGRVSATMPASRFCLCSCLLVGVGRMAKAEFLPLGDVRKKATNHLPTARGTV
jgi:hypothetical protein